MYEIGNLPGKYKIALFKFLNIGLRRDVAEILASGHNRFDLVSPDWNNPVRQKAFEIWDEFYQQGLWSEQEEGDESKMD